MRWEGEAGAAGGLVGQEGIEAVEAGEAELEDDSEVEHCPLDGV